MKFQLLQVIRSSLATALLLLLSISVGLAQSTVTGTVRGEKDEAALIGVNVQVKGTFTGTVTDIDGNYSIDIPASSTDPILVFSYVGYKSQEEAVGGRSNVSIQLEEDFAQLDEIVVIGYGTQKKGDITAAIASVGEEAIQEIPSSSTINALQGRVAGLDISSTGGRPGQFGSVRVRGRRSISASNEPLYVVDGIPLTDAAIAFDVNPNDIISVQVLKDAAATAVYGSRGANGVIIITTRRGTEGGTYVTYDGYYGISNVANTVDVMNGEEFANLKRESARFDPVTNKAAWNGTIPDDSKVFNDPVELESLQLGRSTDYQNLVLDQGYQQNHQFGIRGGTASTQFYLSLNYFEEQGIIPTQDFTRFSVRINADQKIGDFLKVGTSTYLARSIQNWASNPLGEALSNNPLGKPYNDDGSLRFLPTNDGIRTNPLNEIVPGAYIDERVFHNILPSVYAEFALAKGLTFKSTFGPDIRLRRRGLFTSSQTNDRRGAPAQARKEEQTSFGYVWENLINYTTRIGANSNLTLTGLQSIQQNHFENTQIEVRGLPYESQKFNNLQTATDVLFFDSGLSDWQLASFLGRASYDIAGKYLIQASVRADGSSRLAEGDKWSYFPGVSVGWRIGQENFLKHINALSDLKLRVSYGVVGNTSIAPYQTQGALARTAYVFGETAAFGYRLNSIPNSDLGWEKTATLNFGVDYAFFNGRISGTVDYYLSNTTDLLLRRQLPQSTGYSQVLENIGETKGTGIEIGLETVNFDRRNFGWSTSFNFFHNTEEIVSLFGGEGDFLVDGKLLTGDIGNRWFIGYPIGVFYDHEKIGIWQLHEVDEASKFGSVPGEIKLRDVNGDGKITGDDRVILGDDIPDYQLGLTNRFDVGDFDFSFFVLARVGQMIYSDFHVGNNTLAGRYNNLNLDYWTPDNPTNAYPRPNVEQEFAKYNTTMGYFDGSYVKLRNVTLGYNFKREWIEKLRLSRLRAYVQAQNPKFWSKYETFDPETGQEGVRDDNPSVGNRQQNVNGDVPLARIFLFGLNVGF